MPHNRPRIQDTYQHYDQDDLNKAFQTYRMENKSIRSIGRQFGIPESTLRKKIRDTEARKARKLKKAGRKPMLTVAQEQLLVNVVKDAALRDMPVTKQKLIESAKEILKDVENGHDRDYQVPDSNFQGWYRGFRKRHPDLMIRTPESLTRARGIKISKISKNTCNRPKIQDTYQHYDQDDLNEAFVTFRRENRSIRSIGRQFGIPESTLRKYFSETEAHEAPILKKAGRKLMLTAAQEQLLVNFVKDAALRAMSVTKQTLIEAAKEILKDVENGHDREYKVPDSNFQGWYKGFRKRHPDLVIRTPETLTRERRNLSVAMIKQWFSDVKSYLNDNGLSDILEDPTRIFNLDEGGFDLDPGTGKVICIKGTKNCFVEQSNAHKTNITILSTVRADGVAVPPIIIYPDGIAEKIKKIPDSYVFSVGKSNSGYINFESFYDYMVNIFDEWLVDNKVQKPVIVFTDWHETRCNHFLSQALDAKQIILIGLLPNTTHLLQPLDVSVFAPLKTAWKKTTSKYMKDQNEFIRQETFANVAIPLYYTYITKKNIISGFKKCGLHPFNEEAPHYSKITAKSVSTLFEDDVSEMSTQTMLGSNMLHKNVQVNNLDIEILKVAYPNYGKQTIDDMLVDVAKNAPLAKLLRIIPFDIPKKGEVPSSAKQAISPGFKDHNFFPETRSGKGLKNPKLDMEREFTVSSKITVNEIYKQEETVQIKQPKDTKGKVKKSTITKRPNTSSNSHILD
ncbi:unnamed protein product [Meganyctiphanes norvegica]|uniref:HTH CENPB-type domain-containing protein n=1 Tax=Meganyctiphanes norvegica TaxID=48144 RepID=A0AAV2S117_MEGNR